MASEIDAEYFISEIEKVINSENSHKIKFMRVFTLIKQISGLVASNEKRYFPSLYAKFIFLSRILNLEDEYRSRLGYIRKFTNLIRKTPNIYLASDDFNYIFSTFVIIFTKYFKVDLPNDLSNLHNPEAKLISYINFHEKIDRQIVSDYYMVKDIPKYQNDTSYADIKLINDSYQELTLRLSKVWINHLQILWQGCKLFIKNASIDEEKALISCQKETYITIEPEHFIDVSEIAECFHYNGSNPNLYFLNRLFGTDKYFNLMLGNIINHLFDDLIIDAETDFNVSFEKALKTKPLTSIAVAMETENAIKRLKLSAAQQFESLRQVVHDFKNFNASIEPAFVSEEYGIKGRLDLFLEDEENSSKKTIIELKSGNAPNKDLSYRDDGNRFIKTGIWHNHYIQVVCYNMLIDSVFDNRTGDSCILYSNTNEFPLRDAPNNTFKKQEALNLRNHLVAYSKLLRNYQYSIFNNFTLKDFEDRPSFVNNKIIEFSKFYNCSSKLEIDYFHYFISFIEHEIYSSNIGDDTSPDRISKINENIDEKKSSAGSFTGLLLNRTKSDLENLHLVYMINQQESDVKTIRNGDIVNLYSQIDSETAYAGKNQIFKCVVKEITNDEITVSLRNKAVNMQVFQYDNFWIIEEDKSDNLLKKMYVSLFEFLRSDRSFKDLIFGVTAPSFKEEIDIKFSEATDEQNEIIAKAISAEDYYLIQGPPGTGKTSYVLKNIATYLLHNSSENILFLTYTNRSADEICKCLLNIKDIKSNIIRLGSKESSDYEEILLSKYVENHDMNEVFQHVQNARFFVCTVSFAQQNSEIFNIKRFDRAIIDEASQILEPHIIGIISKIRKFIMIGDEKQLPAVVTQEIQYKKELSEELQEINIDIKPISLFERLLKISQIKNFKSFDMLTKQARMHSEIQMLANHLFYNENLVSMELDWQNQENCTFIKDSDNKLERILAKSRVVFIDSVFEPNRKHNSYEADLTVEILKLFKKKSLEIQEDISLGVISPFRAQCSLIRKQLPNDIIDSITIDTVERFQGSERDVIVISAAINFPIMLRSIESIAEINGEDIDRKLNVALTRAKKHLIIIGNSKVLSLSKSYSRLINFTISKNSFYPKILL